MYDDLMSWSSQSREHISLVIMNMNKESMRWKVGWVPMVNINQCKGAFCIYVAMEIDTLV